jgi:hypothetical protein
LSHFKFFTYDLSTRLLGPCWLVWNSPPTKISSSSPPPDPWDNWKNAAIGIVGGIAGGYLVSMGLGMEDLIATSFGALAGGRIFSEVAGSLMSKG